MTTQRKRRIPYEILSHIKDMLSLDRGVTPGQVFQSIGEEFGSPDKPDPVNRRTVERIVKELKDFDQSGPWEPRNTSGEDARLVLETLNHLLITTAPRFYPFTNEEARLIVWIRKAAPTLPPIDAWALARLYITFRSEEETIAIDCFLAMRPWESEEAREFYLQLVREGRIPKLPSGKGTTFFIWLMANPLQEKGE